MKNKIILLTLGASLLCATHNSFGMKKNLILSAQKKELLYTQFFEKQNDHFIQFSKTFIEFDETQLKSANPEDTRRKLFELWNKASENPEIRKNINKVNHHGNSKKLWKQIFCQEWGPSFVTFSEMIKKLKTIEKMEQFPYMKDNNEK